MSYRKESRIGNLTSGDWVVEDFNEIMVDSEKLGERSRPRVFMDNFRMLWIIWLWLILSPIRGGLHGLIIARGIGWLRYFIRQA
ncbi:hypothetical protein J1N35_037247 [Gossypium stocksii]|uniref:Uncharacterized protein n=1 Tax=Gossypium stocksii TaxID=47602 RepID=A0A9D3UJV4_9ROSI|nr:hypothetical protein J1N35_037247 [Gossypium stocksii]